MVKIQNLYTKKSSKKAKGNIKGWTSDLSRLPHVRHEKFHEYLVIGKSFSNEPKGDLKHKVNGHQLFKEGFVKKIRIKDCRV